MTKKNSPGNGRLAESLAAMQQAQTNMLVAVSNVAQHQTSLVQHQTAMLARMAETDVRLAQMDIRMAQIESRLVQIDADIKETNHLNAERFGRIEAILEGVVERLLKDLPEAVHQKFGFQPPPPPTQ